MARLKTYPDLHIYHFAPYEPAALKRIMGRYASREEEIDFLLRSKRFVDLFESFAADLGQHGELLDQELEPLYGYSRLVALPDANGALTKVQASWNSAISISSVRLIARW